MSKHSFLHQRITVAAILLLASVYFSGIESVPFHPDESQWIATSNVFEEYFTGQFFSPVWDQSYWTLTQPPLTRYVIGFGRWLGGFTAQDLNPYWQFDLGHGANIVKGAKPSDELLWWSRFPMAALSVFSILIGWVLVQKSLGRFAGVIWIFLCVINPYLLKTGRRAMGEAPLLICMMLATYAGYQALQIVSTKERNCTKLIIWIGMFGMVAGFAGAAKLNGLSILAAGVMIVAIIAIKQKNSVQRKLIFAGCASMVMFFLAGCSFVGCNPFLWRDPIGRTQKMLDHRLYEIALQQTRYVESHIDSGLERVQIVPKRIFQDYAALNMKGMLSLNIALFVIGFLRAIILAYQGLVNKLPNASLLAILLVGVSASVPALFTPLDWSRYYLLPVWFATVLIVVGLDWCVGELFQLFWGMGRKLGSCNV